MLGLQNQYSAPFEQSRQVMQMQQAMASQQLGVLGSPPGPGQIGVQSLEQMLYIVTYGDNEAKIIQDLRSIPVFNLIHQWTKEGYYGGATPAAVGMAALPSLNNGYYERGYTEVKFYADARMIPQQMLDIESAAGNLIGRYTTDSFMSLVGKVNHAIYFGDSSKNQYEMDGFYRYISQNAPNNVLDARTAQLSPSLVEYLSLKVRANFGDATMNKLYAPPQVISPMTTNFIQQQRTLPILWNGEGGNPFSGWDAQYGPAKFRDDRLCEFDPFNGNAPIQSFTNGVVPQGIPPAPAAAPTVTVNATDANSQWGVNTSQVPGSVVTHAGYGTATTGYYAYCYAYINEFGMGIVSPITAVQTVSDGGSVTLSGPTSGVNPRPLKVRVFRQQLAASGDTPSYSGMQAIPNDIGVTVSTSGWTFTDTNADIPGTYTIFFINTSEGGGHLGRLGPMRKFELAPVNLAYWFAVGWWGMLICPAPEWSVVVKNVSGYQVQALQAAYNA